jgi:signal transduction histidine kinase
VARVRALFRKDEPIRETRDLNSLIQGLVRLLRDEAIRRNVSIELVLAEDLPKADLDPVQIQQVFLNLAINAMDAMAEASEPRQLTIRTIKQADSMIQMTVEDRGTGLTPEAAVRMFEPFFSTKANGTGMGLAICRSIIEAHDGRIWATESAGGGTVFHITLPVRS